MALYADQAGLNQVWGQTTVQARVQNQLYQQAAQADLASGANVVNYGQHTLAQVSDQNIDLSLLRAGKKESGPITPEWIHQNVQVDRTIDFGSEEYFTLADDPALRPLLQSGPNVIFAHEGQVYAVQDPEGSDKSHASLQHPAVPQGAFEGSSQSRQQPLLPGLYSLIRQALGQ